MDNQNSRRAFIEQAAASLGLLCLSSLTPSLMAQAHKHAQVSAAPAQSNELLFFTPEQAAEFDAFSAQIIPADDTPGAREANVVHFVDYALSKIEPYLQADFAAALKSLNGQAAKTAPTVTSFAALRPEQQIEAMKASENTSWFALLHLYTMIGFLCDPVLGGNHDQIGWKLIGFEDKFYYQPPFGYYDAHADEVTS